VTGATGIRTNFMTDPATITISIVTPSFRQPDWLRLCVASVADQKAPGLEVEHIVQDSLSGPEVEEVMRQVPSARFVSEKDEGMYDAINRGWDKAHGDILAWLNCDEQYLPGALAMVADYFRAHPETDVLFADAIIVDGKCDYVCSRQILVPHLYHTWTCHLNTFSCSMFLRSNLLRKRGFRLDPYWKDAGDAVLIRDFLQGGVRMESLGHYTSTFVDTGDNRNLQPWARKESREFHMQAPLWVRKLRPLWRLAHRLRRWTHGQYSPKPFSFEIYTPASPARRMHVEVPRPTYYWASRMNVGNE
jgi:glycosyltransferase involved in cell wall biosynthesis